MLLSDLLAAISLPKAETRFRVVPKKTFLVWTAEALRRGADDLNLITERSVTFEVYAFEPDPYAEQTVESLLDNLGIRYFKYARQWLGDESLYMTAYDFSITEKEGGHHG